MRLTLAAAIVIASAVTADSATVGAMQGLHRVAEVVFGCLVGIMVSLALSRVRFVQPAAEGGSPPQSMAHR